LSKGVGGPFLPPRAFCCFFALLSFVRASCLLRASSPQRDGDRDPRGRTPSLKLTLSSPSTLPLLARLVSHAERERRSPAIDRWDFHAKAACEERGQCSDPRDPVGNTFPSDCAGDWTANVWFEPSEGLERCEGPPPEAFALVHRAAPGV
jgi:hypothetical protein